MTHWKYLTIKVTLGEDYPLSDTILNTYGADGWELIGISYLGGGGAGVALYLFKQPGT